MGAVRMKRVTFNTESTTIRTYTGLIPEGVTEADIFFEGLGDWADDMEVDLKETQEDLVRGTYEELGDVP